MKKRILFCLLTLCVMLAAGVFTNRTEAVTPPANNIYVARNEKAGLMGDVLLYSKGSNKYALYLPGAADAAKLCFSWGSGVTVTNGYGVTLRSGEVYIADPGKSVKLTVNGTSITVETVQGSKNAKAMFLETDTSIAGFYSFSQMNSSSDKSKAAAGMMAFDGTGGYYFSIKGRGNATWTSVRDKKPYNITLYKDGNYDNTKGFELIEGVKAKKWSLLANYYDSSLLRNKLAYDMAVDLGLGLESVYVDLWVDGQYRGNYLMTPKNDYDAPKEGYMLELDNYTNPDSFKITGLGGRITIKENDAQVPMTEISTYMRKAWAAIQDETSEEYLKYIDLDSWAKFYLLHEFYMSFDVMYGSQFMYRLGTSDSDKLIAGPVWDMDNSMGKTQTWAGFNLSYDQQHSPLYDYIQSVNSEDFWLQELGQHESFMERVHEIHAQYRHVFDGAAESVETYQKELEASAQMNYHRWGYQSGRPKISSTGDACGCVKTTEWKHYVENLRNYAEKRAAYLKKAMPATLTGTLTITGEAKAGATLVANVTDCNATTLVYTWKMGDRTATGGNRFVLWGEDYGKPITCTVTSPDMTGSLTLTLNAVMVNLSYAGGEGGATSVRLYYSLAYGQLPEPTREGYTFAGWFTGPNGTGTRITEETPVAKSTAHNLYACWKQVENPVEPTTPPVPGTEPTEGTTDPPVEPTDGTEAPTEPVTGTTAPTDDATEPPVGGGDTTAGEPDGTTSVQNGTTGGDAAPKDPGTKLDMWYILVPAGVLVLLLILLLVLKKRKKN